MKDIIVDNTVTGLLIKPPDEDYKEFVNWLIKFDKGSKDNAHLVVSHALLKEYHDSLQGCRNAQSIIVIIDVMTRQARLTKFSKQEIDSFMNANMPDRTTKKLLSNRKDWSHIAIIPMSTRKFAITHDVNLTRDLNTIFSGHQPTVANHPRKLNYA
jgi:hypothetical protein